MIDDTKPRLRTLRSEFVRKHLPILAPLTGWICEGGGAHADGETPMIAYLRWQRRMIATWPRGIAP